MNMTVEEFKKAPEIIDKIIKDTPFEDIDTELRNELSKVPKESIREYRNHLSTLFLNVLLNRLDEFDEDAKSKSHRARKTLKEYIS